MRSLYFLSVVWILTSCTHIHYGNGVEDNGTSMASVLYHGTPFKMKQIDGRAYSQSRPYLTTDTYMLVLSPGAHDFVFEQCNCSLAGATRVPGRYRFQYVFEPEKQYRLRLSGIKNKFYDFALYEVAEKKDWPGEKVLEIPGGIGSYIDTSIPVVHQPTPKEVDGFIVRKANQQGGDRFIFEQDIRFNLEAYHIRPQQL